MPGAFPSAPPEAVSGGSFAFGRYGGLLGRVNFLDVKKLWHFETPRWIKTWRLKEWRAILLGDATWSFVAALYNAKLFSIAMFRAWDRSTGRRYGFLRIMPGSIIHIGEKVAVSRSSYHGRHARLDIDFALPDSKISVTVNWKPPRAGGPGFHGEFVLDCSAKSLTPNTVVMPIGINRAMYSTKAVVPMEGFFETPDGPSRFEAASASALFDDHKGYYPFGLRYDWVGGFGIDPKGRRVAFSLAGSQTREPGLFNENCLWIGNRLYPLPHVRLSRAEGYRGDWIIQDTEGLVDLAFTPQVHNDVNFHVGLLESDWHGPFGVFKGFIKSGEGETIDAAVFLGMGEEKYLRA